MTTNNCGAKLYWQLCWSDDVHRFDVAEVVDDAVGAVVVVVAVVAA